jgi:hypothetical protein
MLPASDLQAFYITTSQEASGKPKLVGSRGSMVAKLKLKELMEGHHQEWSLWLNLTQHGKSHLTWTRDGLTDCGSFLIWWVVVHDRS